MIIDKEFKIPFYVKAAIFIIGLIAFFAVLYILQGIIVPIVFAVVIAILLHPVVNFIVQKKINRVVAILFALFMTFILIAGLGILLFTQTSQFVDSWPLLVDKFTIMLNQAITWSSAYFNINPEQIHEWIFKTKGELMNISGSAIGQTIMSVGSGILALFVIPVYVFLILFYKPLIIDFISKVFGSSNQSKVTEIIFLIKNVIQRYLIGLVIEFLIVSVLNITVLMILGIDYAILLGILGGLLNLIPYLGGLVGVAMPMIVALTTKDSAWYSIYILILYYIIQLIDNNYIVPKIVASKVKINALFAIIVVFAGNALWGIPGMFLSIPLLAVVKLIFDHVESLKPWGFLLGDTMPSILKIKPVFKRKKKSNDLAG